jgi:chromosome condensin MukBEF ATPase and DNA-binding subunit MukB
MTDYNKLVEALRCKRDDCEGCDLAFFDNDEGWMCQYAAKDDDAADAIEELMKNLNMASQELSWTISYTMHLMRDIDELHDMVNEVYYDEL